MRTRDYFAIAGIVLLVLVLWNYGPAALSATGRFLVGGWAAATNPEVAAEVESPVAATPASVADDAPEVEVVPDEIFAPGSTYSETPLGENIWGNGPKMDWKAVSDPAEPNTYIVVHGDLRARRESAIAVFSTVKAARTFLRDATWVVQYVSITGDGTLVDYLTTLNARLGGTYTVVLKPPVP
ncbi:MAG: hypothetical protein AAB973_01860 [Patescibacteria group bacterium]